MPKRKTILENKEVAKRAAMLAQKDPDVWHYCFAKGADAQINHTRSAKETKDSLAEIRKDIKTIKRAPIKLVLIGIVFAAIMMLGLDQIPSKLWGQ